MFDISKYQAKFISESKVGLTEFGGAIESLRQGATDKSQLEAGFRAAHSLKGSAGMFGFNLMSELAAEAEGLMYCFMEGKASASPLVIDDLRSTSAILAGMLSAVEQNAEFPSAIAEIMVRKLAGHAPAAA
jgi:two-component system, chemotaxis family, sensor kinase CheA